ncbi:hypothetical protein O0I10_006466 [Lichtheimia ornata]|uniref:Arrestin-like N-terminal domain-containing protein n=1 Tax=Lichtheimia ornata TaxID=688661 RepID=A0AAD7XYT7_9FUNG|nr:uncharacterized protein O0I10_006466 [Lichtheimia ornata]KAJ8657938.1 hypothetical protein O0I10_006466 [Lichtheimia ornata]
MNGSGIIAVDLSFPDTVQFFAGRPSKKTDLPSTPLSFPSITYPRRQKLRGKLRIVMSQAIKLNQVEVRFNGHTELAWRDPLKSEHSFLAERMNERKTLRKSKSTLLEEATLPAGVTELGFEITIPGHLCPTFKSKFLDITYMITAKIVPAGAKLCKKPIRVEKEIWLQKTLLPHDIATLAGYQVPLLTMSGASRRGDDDTIIRYEFRVPKWTCLDNDTIDFDGTFSISSSSSSITGIAKVEVDMVEQHFYHYDMTKDDKEDHLAETPIVFGDRLTKRHLFISHNEPSIYLFPPLDTNIAFSFPINNKHSQSDSTAHPPPPCRIKSIPYAPTRLAPPPDDDILPTSCSWILDNAQYYSPATIISKGNLSYSLDSPFLEIRHFIRLVIHPLANDATPQPVCIGLPIHITRKLTPPQASSADELPTYNSITRDVERLPDYVTTMMDMAAPTTNTDDEAALSPTPQEGTMDEVDISDLYNAQRSRQSTHSSEYSNSTASSSHGKQNQHERILIQERRLEDFWIIP